MGLIYSRDDSEKLMEALSKNLASGKEVLTKLKTGSEWLEKVYEQYGKHESIAIDKTYKIGVQPHSGSPNFNPNIQSE
ncbi:hypothetical protein HB981_01600 [Listeria seeligeri]|uniref:hypothetical protein n=1 Tax=Listeria seeligeri TaxID=1640 RepID=UPI0016243FC0|nr:hypothetical protein [Listeria seeligeri]MBC1725203.1 hypothetical protein [Listeria seeligeri]MBC1734490.1 hypothetical protein [Listeria seeligeri]MBF2365510.1 hypothetical protein [Listeria seeligeri]MBF2452554.1 hypothetical protein [Listeria seeligeri]MBF2539236.1 hypothetical protein [Listeria seeligeri]